MTFDEAKLTAFALGELDPKEMALMEAELARSPEKQLEIEEIRRTSQWLTSGLRAEPCPHLTSLQQKRVLDHSPTADQQTQSPKVITVKRWQFWAYIGATAAAACLMALWLADAFKLGGDLARQEPLVAPLKETNRNPEELALRPGQLDTLPLRERPVQRLPLPEGEGRGEGNVSQTPSTTLQQATSIQISVPGIQEQSVKTTPDNPKANSQTATNVTPTLALNSAVQVPNTGSGYPISQQVPLRLSLPIPAFMGTPTDIPLSEHLEKPSDKPRPIVLVPAGVVNVALGKKVMSSDRNPISGYLDLVTDGDKESSDASYVEMHRNNQWAQIDLESVCSIYVIVIWHAHNTPQVYHDVIIQLADDPDFTRNVRTVFNNDYDNSNGLGIGTDKEYFESYEGKLIQVGGLPARFVRAYSKGSSFSALNRLTEIEVYGLPLPNGMIPNGSREGINPATVTNPNGANPPTTLK